MVNGGIIGPRNDARFFSANGVWHMKDVASWLEQGRWYFNRSVTVNATAFTEGDTIIITINTVGVPDGTNLYWSVTTLSGTTLTTAEFSDSILTGVCNIVNNTDNTTKKFRADRIPDGDRQMAVSFRSESVVGPIIASTPVLTLKDFVRGGDSVFDRAGYRYHKFTYSSYLYTSKSVAAEVLLVAGGGGGGGNGGGGGGAGGLKWTNVTIGASNSRYVQVGGGGSWSGGGNNGSDGAGSYIDGVIGTTGGGGGGSRDGGSAGRYGGSGGGGGGGGGGRAGAGPGIGGEGNNGGSGVDDDRRSAGGGGGGATGGGGNAASRQGGNGGAGRGIDFVRDGVTENYAGGGGGGRTIVGSAGSDGVGQGPTRGSGGHGESGGTAYRAGTNGDSGIVFIRYLIPT